MAAKIMAQMPFMGRLVNGTVDHCMVVTANT